MDNIKHEKRLGLPKSLIPKYEIDLDELLESKEFINKVKAADVLTKKTGLEHGFKFCKRHEDEEITTSKICVGDKCSIKIEPEKCSVFDSGFHTHPKGREISKHSIGDLYNSAYNSFHADNPNICCVKAINSKNILCIKSDIKNKETLSEIKSIRDVFYSKYRTIEDEEKISEIIYKLAKSESRLIPTIRIMK